MNACMKFVGLSTPKKGYFFKIFRRFHKICSREGMERIQRGHQNFQGENTGPRNYFIIGTALDLILTVNAAMPVQNQTGTDIHQRSIVTGIGC